MMQMFTPFTEEGVARSDGVVGLSPQATAVPVDFCTFEDAYKQLSEKLRPQVYELGFLRV